MLKTTISAFALSLLLFSLPAHAIPNLGAKDFIVFDTGGIGSVAKERTYSIKSQPYNEASDPLFHSNGPETTTPQHGYFAVPMIVIGLAGILLYFSRND